MTQEQSARCCFSTELDSVASTLPDKVMEDL